MASPLMRPWEKGPIRCAIPIVASHRCTSAGDHCAAAGWPRHTKGGRSHRAHQRENRPWPAAENTPPWLGLHQSSDTHH